MNKKVIGIVSICIVTLCIFISLFFINSKRKIIYKTSIDFSDRVLDFHISTNGILLWDKENLYFLDKEGNLVKSVGVKNNPMDVFFASNFAYLYDSTLGRVYQYDENGQLISNLKLDGKLYNVNYKNNNTILHLKYDSKESLFIMKSDGSLAQIYETSDIILNYDVLDDKNFVVGDIKKGANGFDNLVVINRDGRIYDSINYKSEIGLFFKMYKDKVIMATDKNLYSLEKENKFSVEIPNISDILIIDNSIYLLHSNIITKYSKSLKETGKYILGANVSHMKNIVGSVYVYGDSDIGGEIGRVKEFYYRLKESVEKIDVNGLKIGTLKNGKVDLYEIVNKRNLKDKDENK